MSEIVGIGLSCLALLLVAYLIKIGLELYGRI